MGSFVKYLLDRHGPEPFREAYARLRFEEAYGQTVEELADAWAAFVRDLAVRREARDLTRERFARLSLFERPSPHYVPRSVRAYRRAVDLLDRGDTTRALDWLERSLDLHPDEPETTDLLARTWLALGRPDEVLRLVPPLGADRGVPFTLKLRRADALALSGRGSEADSLYGEIVRVLPRYERMARALVGLRRRLVDRPGELQARLSRNAPSDTAAGSPAGRLWAALHLAEEEAFEAAAALIASTPPIDDASVERMRWVWLGALYSRLGRYVEAVDALETALSAYREADDPNEVERLVDQLEKVDWLSRHAEAIRRQG